MLMIFAIAVVIILGYERKSTTYDKKMPDNFNFLAKVHNNTYTLDTYNNELIKKINWNKDTTIKFIVSDKFRVEIYNRLRDIDIYKYPKNYAPTSTVKVSPSFSYYLKYTIDSTTNIINWDLNTESEKKDAKQLRKLFDKIYNYLEQNEKIKRLPDDRRAFY